MSGQVGVCMCAFLCVYMGVVVGVRVSEFVILCMSILYVHMRVFACVCFIMNTSKESQEIF